MSLINSIKELKIKMSNELSTKLNLALYAQLSNSIEIEEESHLKSLISNCSDEEKKRLINLKKTISLFINIYMIKMKQLKLIQIILGIIL